jgi:hypothetical protein
MSSRILAAVVAIGACAAAQGAAMSAPQTGPCRVVDGAKLPPEVGGAGAICSAIEQAVAARAPNVRYNAEVRVLSKSSFALNAEVSGRKLEEQHFGVMDRNLNPTSIKRFAETIADQIAAAAKKG